MEGHRSFQISLINSKKDLVFNVPGIYADRLQERMLSNRQLTDGGSFFLFKTVDGLSAALNLSDVLAIRFWPNNDHGQSPITQRGRSIRIYLRSRTRPMVEVNEMDMELFDLFTNLELGVDEDDFISILDKYANQLMLRLSEIVWVSASSEQLESGRRLVAIEDGLPLDQ